MRERVRRLREAGSCTNCGAEAMKPGMWRCFECAMKDSARAKRRYWTLKAAREVRP